MLHFTPGGLSGRLTFNTGRAVREGIAGRGPAPLPAPQRRRWGKTLKQSQKEEECSRRSRPPFSSIRARVSPMRAVRGQPLRGRGEATASGPSRSSPGRGDRAHHAQHSGVLLCVCGIHMYVYRCVYVCICICVRKSETVPRWTPARWGAPLGRSLFYIHTRTQTRISWARTAPFPEVPP